ncbi:hypothetical protein HUT16_28250 [Kitasatospora sp. NA04385]|uniref:hypothetical protein n=1 Tax=Kitasatospora sp. NA04385 TaxID=2742135 RepID=UPI0015901FED|nr:hypothetical protein [Kitasatospora sp. NA04385]QKW22450.1 hypothetical protein HUT16_28250 [Kitasatospora sp. NA04385]
MRRLLDPAVDFGRLLRAEWTKLRTVPGWVATVAGALLAIVAVGLLGTAASNPYPGRTELPVGPDGEAVNDSFSFVHRELSGDGTLTVPVLGLTGIKAEGKQGSSPGPVAEWAKAGIIVKAGLDQGSAYAAVAATGGHGVRMQYDYTHDTAGRPGLPTADAPHWLRLTRAGDTVTGYDSADGRTWTPIGTARLPGLPRTVRVGLFATSPELAEDTGTGPGLTPAVATGRFGPPVLSDGWTGAGDSGVDGTGVDGTGADGTGADGTGADGTGVNGTGVNGTGGAGTGAGDPGAGWTGGRVGTDAGTSGSYLAGVEAGHTSDATGFTVTGAGDIAPVVGGPALAGGRVIENFLVGTFVGLIALAVVATGSATAEYRRGLIALTFIAAPRRGRVLFAKSLLLAAVSLLTGTAAAALAVPLGTAWSTSHGFPVATVPDAVRLRVVLGTGLVLAAAAVLALALGFLLRRAAVAITAVVAALVLPYVLATSGALPTGASEWLLRITPAAGFAIQQSLPRLPQVATLYTPDSGYYPLSPWAGLAVLTAWAAAALVAAVLVVRRRDA